jgi:peptidoglycan/xylan/chitin deacetylase (PgdA/CDA1 family)
MNLWFLLVPLLLSQPTPPAPSPTPPAPPAAPQTADGLEVDGNWAQGRQLLLTFDDGPDWENTPVLLDYLDDYGVKAVFFVNGRRFTGTLPQTQKSRAVLVELHRRGHVVGNHTQTHPMMAQTPPDVQRKEIERTHAAIKRTLGFDAWLYRPPFGGMTGVSRAVLREMKYTVVMWNVDSNDPFERHANVSLRNVLRDLALYGRGVALFHDTNSWSTEAVPRIIRSVWLENCHRTARGEPVVEFSNEIEAFWQPRSGKAPEPPLARLQEAARRRARMSAWCDGIRKGAGSP